MARRSRLGGRRGWWRASLRWLAPLLACLALGTLEVSLAAPPRGAPAGERPDPSRADASQGGGGAQGTAGVAAAVGDEHGAGQVNPLDVTNPVCGGALRAPNRRNCEVTGTPEGRYPTSNYGLEIHIDTGLDDIVGNFQALLAQLANAIWMALLFVLNLVLTLLGWAFELSPFTDNALVADVSAGLERFYRVFTSPFFAVALAAIGAWAVYRGLVRGQVMQTLAGTLASVALMLLGLWVLHEPRATVGTVSEITNDAALAVIAAPQEGSLRDPQATYAEATEEVWSAMTLPGFAALNFTDIGWALSEPDSRLLAKANESACRDYAYLRTLPERVVRRLAAASSFGEADCGDVAAAAPAPRTNAEIWLRSSPGSEARDSLWDEFTDEFPYSSHFAIQGDGGAWTRLPLVCLIALGLLGGIALLAWLAIRIFVQTAVAFVLVLSAPVALFLPAFGERGRAAFAFWGGTLAGALVSKLVYAALLAVVLFATTVVSSAVPEGAGEFMAFLVSAGLWWAVFLKRDDILSFLSVTSDEGGSGRVGAFTGLYLTRQIGERLAAAPALAARTAGAGARAGRGGVSGRLAERGEATRGAARAALDRQAEARLGSRYEAERTLLGEQASRRKRLAELAASRTDAVREARRHAKLARASDGPERERHREAERAALARAEEVRAAHASLRERVASAAPREAEAREFVSAAERLERDSGSRFTREQLAQAREAIRREADRPVSDPAHAWRVGMAPERYAALAGRERESARAEVARQLRADGAAFGAIADRPAGLAGARRTERVRRELRSRPGGVADLEHARRRARQRRAARRGVSR
jgi:hypothetical protein